VRSAGNHQERAGTGKHRDLGDDDDGFLFVPVGEMASPQGKAEEDDGFHQPNES